MSDTRTVAVVFTDMEASTEVSLERGDEAAMQLLRVHEVAVRDAAARHGGRVVKSTGDGYLLAFDECVDAVAAALFVRNALDAHNAQRPDDPVRVRIGINVGPAIDESGDLYGLAVNAGARITAKAAAGQVLVSDEVRRAVAGARGWTFVDRGLFWLKGIRAQWRLYEVSDGAVADVTPGIADRLPFVGRDDERAALRRVVDAAADGAGALVLVHGAGGAGKTRLVEEVGQEAAGRGLQFVVGRAYETLVDAAYAPIVAVLEGIERRTPVDAFREALGEAAADIARLLPHLRDAHPGIAPPAELPVQELRASLFVALRDTLARVGAGRPLVVLLDDVHWADEASLRFLEYLAGELASLPVAVFATYADDEPPTAAFGSFLAGLSRRRLLNTVAVGPLDPPSVAGLLETATGAPPPRAVVDLVHDATGGNALFVDEVVRGVVADGRLLHAGCWRQDVEDVDLAVPDSVRRAIDARLARISASTRAVLTTAAAVGRDVPFDLLEQLAELAEDDLLDALDEAERAHLITATAAGDDVCFAFTHGLIRRALADEVSLTRRQRLHVRIADALERVYAAALADHAADIAFHLGAAGRWASADRRLRFMVMAGERALETAAFAEALRHFDRAIAVVPSSDDRERAALLEKMGMCERSLGHLDDALALWNEALGVYRTLDLPYEVARLCLAAAIQVAWWRRGREVMALVERGLAALGDDDSSLRGGLLALAGGVASQAGDYDEATRLLNDALAIARRHRDDAVLGLALYSLAVHHFSYYQYENVVAAGRASVEHLRLAGDLWNLANVQGYVAASLGWLGRFGEAAEVGEEAEALGLRLGNWSAYVFADGAKAFTTTGAEPSAKTLADRGARAKELGEELGFTWLTSIGHTRLGFAAFWRGDWEEALEHVEAAARREARTASGGHLGRLFLLHAYLGHREVALELIDSAEPAMPVVGRPNSGTSWTLALAAVEALALLGERRRAARLYPTVVDLAATGPVMRSWDYRLVSTLAGIAAGCDGEWELARRHFAHGRDLAVRLPMQHELPEALRFEAATLLARDEPGDRDEADRLLVDAARLYDELAMSRHAEVARAMRP